MSTLVLVVKKVHMALFVLKNSQHRLTVGRGPSWLLHVSCQLSHQSQCFQLGKQRHPNPVQQFQCPLLLWEERASQRHGLGYIPHHATTSFACTHEIVYGAPSDVAGDARQLDIIAICADCQMINV